MQLINQQLQQQILEYGNSLHVSQRGLFQRAVQYPRWKKRWFGILVFKEDFSKIETLEELRGLDSWYKGEKEEDETFLDEENVVTAFFRFLYVTFWSPLMLALFSPFVAELLKQKITWYSISMSSLMEAMALGVLVELDTHA